MEASNQQIKVGLFVSVGLVGLVLSILLLAGESTLFEPHIKLYIEMSEVEGLGRGSIVSLNGLRVGNVRRIDFDSEPGLLKVELDIRSKYQKNIPSDSVAEVRTAGALGDKFIYIRKGSKSADHLKDGDTLKFSDDQGLLGVLSERGAEFEMAFDILRETKTLMESVNREQHIERILASLSQTSEGATNTVNKSTKLVEGLNETLEKGKLQDSLLKLNKIMTKIDSGEGTLGALVNDPELHESLKELLGGAPRKKHLKGLMRRALEVEDSSSTQ